jgi:hypothetical protein
MPRAGAVDFVGEGSGIEGRAGVKRIECEVRGGPDARELDVALGELAAVMALSM